MSVALLRQVPWPLRLELLRRARAGLRGMRLSPPAARMALRFFRERVAIQHFSHEARA